MERQSEFYFWAYGVVLVTLIAVCMSATHSTLKADKLAKEIAELKFTLPIKAPAGRGEPFQPCRATVTNIHDADTFECVIHLPFGVDLPGRSIRAQGYDAWEVTRARQTVGEITDAEIVKGKQARDELAKLCDAQSVWLEPSTNPGVYGRTSANVWLRDDKGQWTELSVYAKDHGWCRPEPKQ